jgi:hypothetical protein
MILMIRMTCFSFSLKSKDGFGQGGKLGGQSAFYVAPTRKIKVGKRDKVPIYIELGGGEGALGKGRISTVAVATDDEDDKD